MNDLTYLIIGFMAGGALAGLAVWFIAKGRYGAEGAALNSRLSEVRSQFEAKTSEAGSLREELDAMRSRSVEAEAGVREAERGLAQQKDLLDKMAQTLEQKFKAVSMDALSKNTEEFMKYAEKALGAQKDMGTKELQGKKELIDQSLEGMGKKLHEVQKRIEDMGKNNVESLEGVSRNIKQHAEITEQLSATAERLRQTLASAKKRGEWGERMAEDVIKLAGMIEGINYSKQKTLEDSRGRPDYTFSLPNSLKINMDVKFPMDNYLNFLEAETDADRKHYRSELKKNVVAMIDSLATREYINKHTVDYVLMFIPNEQVYGFINESDVTIMDRALKHKVILCSPFTLYAVLAVVRQAVENFALEQTASEILKLLGDFNKQWDMYKEKFQALGKKLDQARTDYDALDGTRTRQLERPLRKLEDIRKQKAISDSVHPAVVPEIDEESPLLD